MKLFQNIAEALDVDFFRIVEENGAKKIIFDGYVYGTDAGGYDRDGSVRPDFNCRILEYSGAEAFLEDYLSGKEPYDSLAESSKQYIEDTNEEGALYAARHWFGINVQANKCDVITADLPCGYYYIKFA